MTHELHQSNEHTAPDNSPASTVAKSETFPSLAAIEAGEATSGAEQAELDITVAEFLEEIFYELQEEEHICLGRKKPNAGVIHAEPHDKAMRNVMKGTDALPAYFNTCTVKPRGEDGWLSRKAVDVMRCYCVCFDDIGTKAKEPPVEPSWKALSSLGNEQWGYIIDPSTEFDRITGFLRWAAEKGYTDAGAANSHSRLFRVPGSVHASKPDEEGNPFRTRITFWNPKVWSIDELISAFGAKEEDFPHVARATPSSLVVQKANSKRDEGLACAAEVEDKLLVWLSEHDHVIKDDGGDWVTIKCPWANDHTKDEDVAYYSPLGRGSDEDGPDEDTQWVQTRGFKCHHGHCDGRHYAEFSKWVVSQGGPLLSGRVDPRPTLKVTAGNFAGDVDKICAILADVDPRQYFSRGNRPVTISQSGSIDIDGVEIPAGVPVITPMTPAVANIELTKCIRFMRQTEKGEKTIDPPARIVSTFCDTAPKRLPPLINVVSFPIIGRGGEIIDKPGYHPETGLYYDGSAPPLAVPDNVTLAMVEKAVDRLLDDVFGDFPFVNELDEAVVLASLVNCALRHEYATAPISIFNGNHTRVGKGLLIEAIVTLVTGHDAATVVAPTANRDTDEELRKKITAILMQGVQHLHLDNWVVPIQGAVMSSLLTTDVWSDRVLGVSEMVSLPARVALFASGNNTTVVQDMVPRSIQVRLRTDLERPGARTDFRQADLIAYIRENRAALLTDLYTIIRGFRQAGSPNTNRVTLGRFERWAGTVGAMVDWAMDFDVVDSQSELLENDPEDQKAAEFLAALREVFGDEGFYAADIVEKAKSNSLGEDDRLSEIMEVVSRGRSPNVIGTALRGIADQNIGGLVLRRAGIDGHRKVNRWRVEPIIPTD